MSVGVEGVNYLIHLYLIVLLKKCRVAPVLFDPCNNPVKQVKLKKKLPSMAQD